MPFLIPIGAAAATAAGALGASTAVAAGVGGFTTLLAAGGLAFAGIKTLGALTAKPDTPSAPAALPSAPSFEQVQKDEQKKNLELARRKRTGTTLTSSQGLLSTEESSQKTLLGG